MDMKTLCKATPILDGTVTAYMIPYTTMLAGRVVDEMDALTELFPENDKREYWMHIFRLMEQFLVDLEFTDSDNAHVAGLELYWQNRNGSMAERAILFADVISQGVMTQLYETYEDTRELLPGVSETLAAGKPSDPDEKKSGGKPSKKK